MIYSAIYWGGAFILAVNIVQLQVRCYGMSQLSVQESTAGVDVTVASVETTLQITASRHVKLVADKLIHECSGPYDCIALPV